MKIQELRQLPLKKLKEFLKKTRKEYAMLRFHTHTKKNQNTAKIKQLRKSIARVLTLMNKK